ncbi:MAG: histidinol-phosphate transaminase [Pseudomonadota bacterium]|nr:MAG: histidinol-phosphate transaminase [Pseudomonadota bacterium]
MSWLNGLARPDILALKPYEHATWEPIYERMHANELPWRALGDDTLAGLNRYPEPFPRVLAERLAALYGVPVERVLVGRGSDEHIDLLTRAFCRAGQDAVLICPPTFGMYSVAARIQGADLVTVPLDAGRGFALDERAVLERCDARVKLVFLCSPNNPTGNLLDEDAVLRLAEALTGRALLVVDEAYLEFAEKPSLARHIDRFPHIAVLRTLSKAHGLAGARCGTLIAHPDVIALLSKVIQPYAITQLTIEAVLRLLEPAQLAVSERRVATIIAERARLAAGLAELPGVIRVWPSAANFLLVELHEPDRMLERVRDAGILIRDVRRPGLERAVRISVGTPEQNDRVIGALR